MAECLHSFSTNTHLIGSKYLTEVFVYSDRIVITRTGKTVLAKEMTISFDDITAITPGGPVWGNSWISFSVPGVQKVHQNTVMIGKPNRQGQVAFSGDARPFMDPCSVVYEKGQQEQALEDYRVINDIYMKYKTAMRDKHAGNVSAIMQESSLDQLKKLKELYDLGIINDAEYNEKREKLLQQIG